MAFNYKVIAATSQAVIKEFGQQVVMVSKVAGAYDPATGSASVTSSVKTGYGVVLDYGVKNIDGELIKAGDKQLLLSTSGITTPTVNDVATIGSDLYTITMVKTLSPAGTPLLFDCNIRK